MGLVGMWKSFDNQVEEKWHSGGTARLIEVVGKLVVPNEIGGRTPKNRL